VKRAVENSERLSRDEADLFSSDGSDELENQNHHHDSMLSIAFPDFYRFFSLLGYT